MQQQLIDIPHSDPDVDLCAAATVHLSAGCIPEETIVAPLDYKSECANTIIAGDILIVTSPLEAHGLILETLSPCDLNAHTVDSGSASETSIITENNSKDVADFVHQICAIVLPHFSEPSDTNTDAMMEVVQTVSSSQSDISLDSMVDSRRDSHQVSSRCSGYSSECNVELERRGIGDSASSPPHKIRCIRDMTEGNCVTKYHTPMLEMVRSDVCTIISLNDGDDCSSSNTDDDSLSVRHTDNICISEDGNMKVAVENEHAVLLIAPASSEQ